MRRAAARRRSECDCVRSRGMHAGARASSAPGTAEAARAAAQSLTSETAALEALHAALERAVAEQRGGRDCE